MGRQPHPCNAFGTGHPMCCSEAGKVEKMCLESLEVELRTPVGVSCIFQPW